MLSVELLQLQTCFLLNGPHLSIGVSVMSACPLSLGDMVSDSGFPGSSQELNTRDGIPQHWSLPTPVCSVPPTAILQTPSLFTQLGVHLSS